MSTPYRSQAATNPQPAGPARPRPDFGLLGGRGLPTRLTALMIGLLLYGISGGLMIASDLGNMPWDVLHQGLSHHVPLSIGTVAVIVSLLVLLLWIPLRQRPGICTVLNALTIGPVIDLTTAVVHTPSTLWAQIALVIAGVVLNGFATVLYIAPALGPGPRDGLMTGLVALTGRPIVLIRSLIEVIVMASGWALGGNLLIATFAYAFGIGAVTAFFLRLAGRLLGAGPLPTSGAVSGEMARFGDISS